MSIFSATRDSAMHAGACIESLLAQDFASWECIYIDDASADATSAVVMAAARSDPRITLIKNGEHHGKVANFLSCWPCMRGDIIVIIDGDDHLSRPDALSLIAACYDADAAVEATVGRMVGHDKPLTAPPHPRYAAMTGIAYMPHSWSRHITERMMAEMPHVFLDPRTRCPWANGGDIVLVSPALCFAERIADVGREIYRVSGSRDGDTGVQIDCIERCREMWLAIERRVFEHE